MYCSRIYVRVRGRKGGKKKEGELSLDYFARPTTRTSTGGKEEKSERRKTPDISPKSVRVSPGERGGEREGKVGERGLAVRSSSS